MTAPRPPGGEFDLIRGKYTDPNDNHAGEVSHFRALTSAPPSG